jgi:hypothetical protein
MGELDLQPAFGSGRALAEYLEDQAGPVDHLGLCAILEILLLDRRDRAVDDEQLRLAPAQGVADLLDLARAEQGCRARLADLEGQPLLDLDADRLGEADGLLEPGLDVALRTPPEVGKSDDGAGAAGELVGIAIENAQPCGSSPWASARLTGRSG